jgi:hypothetical protein
MRILITLSLILLSTTTYSQDYNSLQKTDTIYVLFKGGKFEKKGVSPDNVDRSYSFYGFEKELYFFHSKYHSYERKIANIISDVKTVNVTWIKKNKTNIVTRQFLRENNLCNVVVDILNPYRTIYVIDCTEKKDGKIILYEVQMSTICRGDG